MRAVKTRYSQIDIVKVVNNSNILPVGMATTRQSEIVIGRGSNKITYRLWEQRMRQSQNQHCPGIKQDDIRAVGAERIWRSQINTVQVLSNITYFLWERR